MWEWLGATPVVVRLYVRTVWQWGRLQRLIDALIVGVFFGWMDRGALAALDVATYGNLREPVGAHGVRYEDPEHIRSGLTAWEKAALSRHLEPGARIVITSAGAGREVFGALQMGFRPVAFEPHEGLQAAGDALLSSEGHSGLLRRCPRDDFPAQAPEADGVLIGWGAYSHITPRARRIAFLREARARLERDRPLIASFWMLPGEERQIAVTYHVARLVRRLRRLEPPERGDVLRPHFLHAFTAEEIRSELHAAGFGSIDLHLSPYPHVVALAS